jgi:hypothetical protein
VPVFEQTLQRVVPALEEQTAEQDRYRWLRLLSYVDALIYHERDSAEHAALKQKVFDSLETDPHRAKVLNMGKTMAEVLKEEGRREEAVRSRRDTLLEQLRLRFERIPEGIVRRVEATDDAEQLGAWLKAFAKAKKLADVGIPPWIEHGRYCLPPHLLRAGRCRLMADGSEDTDGRGWLTSMRGSRGC